MGTHTHKDSSKMSTSPKKELHVEPTMETKKSTSTICFGNVVESQDILSGKVTTPPASPQKETLVVDVNPITIVTSDTITTIPSVVDVPIPTSLNVPAKKTSKKTKAMVQPVKGVASTPILPPINPVVVANQPTLKTETEVSQTSQPVEKVEPIEKSKVGVPYTPIPALTLSNSITPMNDIPTISTTTPALTLSTAIGTDRKSYEPEFIVDSEPKKGIEYKPAAQVVVPTPQQKQPPNFLSFGPTPKTNTPLFFK